jgi:competence protein ComEA
VGAAGAPGRNAASRRVEGKEHPVRHLFVTALAVAATALALVTPASAAPMQEKAAEAKASPAPVVNINTAPAEQLERLPGVGPKTAARIVEYRQKNGGFKKVEELMNVRGIGEKAFLKMKNQLTVTVPKADPQ